MFELRTAWETLLHQYSNDRDIIQQFWNEIETKYSGKSRKYHSLKHIERMFQVYDRAGSQFQLEDSDMLEFAIWYHDIIYSATKKNNEVKSAQLAKLRLASLGIEEERNKLCHNLILSTKDHSPLEESIDNKLMIDLDLEILAADWKDYLEYTKQIREEYKIYPDFLYKKGRKKALEHFLQKEKIYQTDWFRDMLESKARANIKKEIELLN